MSLGSVLGVVAKNLLSNTDFGEPATLTRTTHVYDPATGSTTPTPITYSVNVVAEDYADALVDGSTIKAGDRKLSFSASGLAIEPTPGTDTITLGSTIYQVHRAKPTKAGAVVVLWTVQARQ